MTADRWLGVVAAVALLGACRGGASRAAPSPPRDAGLALPDIGGFEAGAVERGAAYVRRNYVRGHEILTVTLARFAQSEPQYREWLRASADFPQAQLGVASADGNGFFECAADQPDRCNLLIQLRCGLHIEIRGPSAARKEDAAAVAVGLDLPGLVASCGSH